VELSAEELERIDSILPPGAASRPRHHEAGMATINL
jgi:hypothetical protein